MCGIAGFVTGCPAEAKEIENTLQAMGKTLHHRGPDDGGLWRDPEAGIGLMQRRLSIIDLSPAGHQPMVSGCGRFVIVYNGELYNSAELRGELSQAGCRFRGHSDTEVALEACAAWGVRTALRRMNAMFALALWDRRDRRLSLARDQVGIKPLYYGGFEKVFFFASELRALRAYPGWTPAIDPGAVAAFLRHNYIPAPMTIYRQLYKLPPGTLLTLNPDGEQRLEAFCALDNIVSAGAADPFAGSDGDAVEQLDSLLQDAVRRQMISDVPLGAFLSGGIDSSTVVAQMQRAATGKVRTFSIGFHQPGFDEARHASAVAAHLGTDHTELYLSEAQMLGTVPKLATLYDEPFADSSQIPTYLVCEMTRRQVTVALSGDGGDELFGGYSRYLQAEKLSETLGRLPPFAKRAAAAGLRCLSPRLWDHLFAALPGRYRPQRAGERLHRLSELLRCDRGALYHRLVSHTDAPTALMTGGEEGMAPAWTAPFADAIPDFIDRMRYLDLLTYLPDDILTKVDRASMAVSLEVRVPILDHRIIAFAWRLPRRLKIRDGRGKWLLRQVLYRYCPRELVDRPKMGFGVPLDAWLRGPLQTWAEDLLTPAMLQKHHLLNPQAVRAIWEAQKSGRHNRGYLVWNFLMLQAWLEANGL